MFCNVESLRSRTPAFETASRYAPHDVCGPSDRDSFAAATRVRNAMQSQDRPPSNVPALAARPSPIRPVTRLEPRVASQPAFPNLLPDDLADDRPELVADRTALDRGHGGSRLSYPYRRDPEI